MTKSFGDTRGCTVVGNDVPLPTEDNTVRIGSGERYLEITGSGDVRFVGCEVTEGAEIAAQAIQAMLDEIRFGTINAPIYRVQ